MHQAIEFKTAFIKMTRNPASYAKALEKKLNELHQEGWEMTRMETDLKKGTLLVAHRVNHNVLRSAMGQHPLAVLLGIDPSAVRDEAKATEEADPEFSKSSQEVLDHIYKRMHHLPPRTDEKKALEEVVSTVCRKFPTEVLRKTVEEVRAALLHHDKHAHPDAPGTMCREATQLKMAAEAIEAQVAKSVV